MRFIPTILGVLLVVVGAALFRGAAPRTMTGAPAESKSAQRENRPDASSTDRNRGATALPLVEIAYVNIEIGAVRQFARMVSDGDSRAGSTAVYELLDSVLGRDIARDARALHPSFERLHVFGASPKSARELNAFAKQKRLRPLRTEVAALIVSPSVPQSTTDIFIDVDEVALRSAVEMYDNTFLIGGGEQVDGEGQDPPACDFATCGWGKVTARTFHLPASNREGGTMVPLFVAHVVGFPKGASEPGLRLTQGTVYLPRRLRVVAMGREQTISLRQYLESPVNLRPQ